MITQIASFFKKILCTYFMYIFIKNKTFINYHHQNPCFVTNENIQGALNELFYIIRPTYLRGCFIADVLRYFKFKGETLLEGTTLVWV